MYSLRGPLLPSQPFFPIGLTAKGESIPVPCGYYNGKRLFHIGMNKVVQLVQFLWRYGFDFIKMTYFVTGFTRKLGSVYSLQEKRVAYANVESMLTAMGGNEMSNLMKISAHDYMLNDMHWNKELTDEFVRAPIRLYYGQNTSVNAFVGMVSILMIENIWRVVGGNHQVAECVLKDSGSSLVMEDVASVIKCVMDGSIKYTITTADGKIDEGYDIVIVANPLNTSSVRYENFSSDIYTAAATTPYQRFVTTFCKGKINQKFFGEKEDFTNFPQAIITTDVDSLPFKFGGVGIIVPSDVQQADAWKYHTPLHENPERVWEVASPEPLTRDQILMLFPESNPDDTVCHDWLGFPQHLPPYQAPSFILDDGVFYINAIEMAASTMEMTAIGAKNAALLARDYLVQNNS
jgi:prenylcysteine oxidase/farnesylcysteine lyase